jgi:hypothetical protein
MCTSLSVNAIGNGQITRYSLYCRHALAVTQTVQVATKGIPLVATISMTSMIDDVLNWSFTAEVKVAYG